MNKQNKKIAQEKRRIEREKAEKKAKVVNLLKFWVPVVAILLMILGVLVAFSCLKKLFTAKKQENTSGEA